MTMKVPLTQDMVALVDDQDYERVVRNGPWHINQVRNTYYAVHDDWSSEEQRPIKTYMHRLILDVKNGELVDHINRNGLDNRRKNLRKATPADNSRNAHFSVGQSGFRGVYTNGNNWAARIQVEGERIGLGTYKEKEEAALAYDKAALEHHGEFAVLNFPTRWRGESDE